ncbi:hypothetical protein MPH_01018 [Macrophomina phaseolina MS6]|uniref:Uncharacterized protein n=1 Tax=Macrophomina phaseolina (strain MS6) TaxID=1126212 RepID=K2SYI4_MACPH|nr:hypothetical protein MPH_01018 [Macrophomina phaseolina MS6]
MRTLLYILLAVLVVLVQGAPQHDDWTTGLAKRGVGLYNSLLKEAQDQICKRCKKKKKPIPILLCPKVVAGSEHIDAWLQEINNIFGADDDDYDDDDDDDDGDGEYDGHEDYGGEEDSNLVPNYLNDPDWAPGSTTGPATGQNSSDPESDLNYTVPDPSATITFNDGVASLNVSIERKGNTKVEVSIHNNGTIDLYLLKNGSVLDPRPVFKATVYQRGSK